ncbi:MAG: GldG family protein, partial [Candidatus Gracilibacteria bacterium]|nr:GldG family protein [Candidatus Gracilibacteria bacterium]
MDYRDKLKHSVNSKALALIVLGILVLLNILSLRYFFRFDWTQNKQYSISDSTVSILHDLDDLVTVKAYFSDDLPPQALPIRQYVQDLLSEYKAYGSGHFDYEFVDPSTNSDVAQEASGLGVQEIRMQVVENDSLQVKNGYMGIGLFFGGNTEGIPVLQAEELGNLEYDLTSRILKMSQPREMVVAFLSGHGEHEIGTGVPFVDQGKDVDYAIAGQQMRANYAVRTLDFSAGDTLEGVDVLVVAGPKRDLSDRDIFEIDQYLLQGGKAVFLIDGIDQIE